MDTDKAYILGLIIGGGIWGNVEDIFRIRLPYKQWGSYILDPSRASLISKDILRFISPLFRTIYGISVSYDTSESGVWNILCEGDLTQLVMELNSFGIECEGEIRKNADIKLIIENLVDDNLKRRFIAGLADTIGSTAKSHRRFNEDKQIISFEISGFSFDFVCSLCRLLHSIGCYPDQILWNHPNFHSGSNPYYKQWKKGFKLRVLLDQYEKFGAFAFTSKATSVKDNKKLQNGENIGEPCEERVIRNPSVTCIHCDENSSLLPYNIRGGHYLHNRHVCAVLGCSHAPYNEVKRLLQEAEQYINPFPIIVKGTLEEIRKLVKSDPIFNRRDYVEKPMLISDLREMGNDTGTLLFKKGNAGYPMNVVMNAITFLIAADLGLLHGNRPKGKKDKILDGYLKTNPTSVVIFECPEIFTPLIVKKGNYAALIGPSNPDVYRKLIKFSSSNEYKFEVSMITEADLL